jgi:hypothetical protein
MFVGHYAASLALKAADRRVPTLPLFLGVQVLDIASAALVLAGIEHWRVVPGITAASPLELDVPYTHGFLTSLSWAVLCALIAWVVPLPRGSRLPRARLALFVGAAVWSHWWFDLIVHRPDLPLYDSALYVGLGLWYSRPGTLVVESGLLILGLYWYLRSSTPHGLAGKIAMPLFVLLLILVNVANIYGPPPPSSTVVAISAEVAYFAIALIAVGLDRFRTGVSRGSTGP